MGQEAHSFWPQQLYDARVSYLDYAPRNDVPRHIASSFHVESGSIQGTASSEIRDCRDSIVLRTLFAYRGEQNTTHDNTDSDTPYIALDDDLSS